MEIMGFSGQGAAFPGLCTYHKRAPGATGKPGVARPFLAGGKSRWAYLVPEGARTPLLADPG